MSDSVETKQPEVGNGDVTMESQPEAPKAEEAVQPLPKVNGMPTVEGKTEEEVQDLLTRSAKQSEWSPPHRHARQLEMMILATRWHRLLVYFYFSDSNLPVDKFFFSLTVCNPEGWVPIKTIMTFKRMSEFQPLGVPFVAYGLRQAALAEGKDPLVAISEDGENVRRKRPLEPSSTAWGRSVYVVSTSVLRRSSVTFRISFDLLWVWCEA
jgi:lupus La protein